MRNRVGSDRAARTLARSASAVEPGDVGMCLVLDYIRFREYMLTRM